MCDYCGCKAGAIGCVVCDDVVTAAVAVSLVAYGVIVNGAPEREGCVLVVGL